MQREDLKTGMLVQCRNDEVALVINDNLVFKTGGYIPLGQYDKDLRNGFPSKNQNEIVWDIMRVSRVLNGDNLNFANWTGDALRDYLLWDREDITATTQKVVKTRDETFDIISGKWSKL